MIAIYFATSTIVGLLAATSAYGMQPDAAAVVAHTPNLAGDASTSAPVVRERRYCITDRREGADRRPKICRTRDEWRARGFDPLVAIGEI